MSRVGARVLHYCNAAIAKGAPNVIRNAMSPDIAYCHGDKSGQHKCQSVVD
jgi:hypothetical protein